MNAETWATIGTIVVTLVFLVVPTLVYAWYVLDRWIGDEESYARVMAEVDPAPSRTRGH